MRATKKISSAKKSAPAKIDPLYIIFEQHLFNFQDPDMDRKTLILTIVREYLTYLRRRNVIVPRALEQPIVEELANQVNTMLVKKIYGCFNLKEYQKSLIPSLRKKARSRFTKLATDPQIKEPKEIKPPKEVKSG